MTGTGYSGSFYAVKTAICRITERDSRDWQGRRDTPNQGFARRACRARHAHRALGRLASILSILLDHFSEVFDRTMKGIFELYLRFPIQKRARPTDIGPSDFGIIGGQRMMGDLAR